MKILNSKAAILLILGDLVAYIFSLIFTLTIRYGELPTRVLLMNHIPSFSILFAVFLIVSFGAGLYDKQSSFIRNRITGLVIKVQIINAIVGIMFFYFAPVGIAPKANLFIYLVISTVLLLLWRSIMYPVINLTRNQPAILVGKGTDIDDLYEEINASGRYGIIFKEKISEINNAENIINDLKRSLETNNASIIVVDLHNDIVESIMPFFYSLVFSGKQIIDVSKLYENVFDRIPLSLVGEKWLVENAATALGSRKMYDSIKRIMDIVIAGIIMIISLVIYPFVSLAIKTEDKGTIFITQERIGKNGKTFLMKKFRSMSSNDNGKYNTNGKSNLRITRIGKFIRMTRIDELPQLLSVIKGDQSLIGPRPELPSLVSVYEKEVPYYNVRHLIKPGLSGWAQIYHKAHPHHSVAVEETRDKLSYDLYYIKNRSLGLDARIALQTAKAILSRQGV